MRENPDPLLLTEDLLRKLLDRDMVRSCSESNELHIHSWERGSYTYTPGRGGVTHTLLGEGELYIHSWGRWSNTYTPG